MMIALYGGSFNPPHLGHVNAAKAVCQTLSPDKMIIMPANNPPHKTLPEDSADALQRLEMCRLAFGEIPNVEISDLELKREGPSYTADTLKQLMEQYPQAEFVLMIGTDMLLGFEKWYEHRWIMQNAALAVFARNPGESRAIEAQARLLEKRFGARVHIVRAEAFAAASSEIRSFLRSRGGRKLLSEKVYDYIIKYRLYGAAPSFVYLREKAYSMLKPQRIPHVKGCEKEAVKLARHYGEDAENAAEAAILHDITKKLPIEDQLILCDKYDIICDEVERSSEKLLHAKTGAAIAKYEFGVSEKVSQAIYWHTTGKAGMNLLEKIIYMADYIEPNRRFEGLEELRKLAYEDLDKAMLMGIEMSLEDIRRYGVIPHKNTLEAYEDLKKDE